MVERFGKSIEDLKRELKFYAIFLWSDAVNLELNLQAFMDLLVTKDGRVGQTLRSPGDP